MGEMILDEARVNSLAVGIALNIRNHLGALPMSRDNVFEALNALAINAAVVLAGTDNDPGTREFFNTALQNQLRGLAS